jgi:bifunctional UDP-N-acetylglucosamine pyrophosphorylase/glucosamine-1-phosphate N-acetyltransferase
VSQLDLAIVLAAGEGTRMKSALPKVLHPIAGLPILDHVLNATSSLEAAELRVVIGAARELVGAHIESSFPKANLVLQEQRNGTGHAVQLALESAPHIGTVLILAGDTPLLTAVTLQEFFETHHDLKADASVLSAHVPDPFGYGRIVRGDDAELSRIVEERDANPLEREIDEINTGVYLFDIAALRTALAGLKSGNSQGELYLTDVIELLKAAGKTVVAIASNDYTETLGINDRSQLAECTAIMRDRINDAHMKNGVTIIDPTTTWIDVDVEIERDVTIYPGTSISGVSKIESGALIGPRTTLETVIVGAGARIVESRVSQSTIESGANVGPFSFIRPGTTLATDSKVGAYVEVKNSVVGAGSKVPHLSYVGDATIGSGTNIGAATIFVNYDGVEKHQTTIGNDVRIGSDTMLVAPLTVGDGAYTAAGSVITEDVPAGSIGVARAKQRNVLGWVLRKRAGSKSAESARKAGATEGSNKVQGEA